METDAAPEDQTTRTVKDRLWVWRATLESREAGKVSVLACVETLFAVVLYWWIAIRFDTHWHLVSSVFIAPLLLLRSPESITAGVKWFLRDWFEFGNYENWAKQKRTDWIVGIRLISGAAVFLVAHWLANQWLPILEAWSLMAASASIITIGTLIAAAGAVAVAGMAKRAQAVADKVAGAGVGASVGAVAIWGTGAGVSAEAVAGLVAGVGASLVAVTVWGGAVVLGPGFALRALTLRIIATVRFALSGFTRVPENWRENNFLTDSFVPAELLPGIRDFELVYTSDGLYFEMKGETDSPAFKWIGYPVLGLSFFLPALIYRLNIKATAWFWWPLAYLLRPAPVADAESQQKQALCWPWTNPFQTFMIGVSALVVVASLLLTGFNLTAWMESQDLMAVHVLVKAVAAVDWHSYQPWHWAQWIIAGCGIGMLWIAGEAVGNDTTGNWKKFSKKWPTYNRLMIGLRRIRTLATIALLIMGLGALSLVSRGWMNYVPVPDGMIQAMEQFYGVEAAPGVTSSNNSR